MVGVEVPVAICILKEWLRCQQVPEVGHRLQLRFQKIASVYPGDADGCDEGMGMRYVFSAQKRQNIFCSVI